LVNNAGKSALNAEDAKKVADIDAAIKNPDVTPAEKADLLGQKNDIMKEAEKKKDSPEGKLDSGNVSVDVPNGNGPNGSGPNGSGPNGSGPNGTGPNGTGPNGSSPNGSSPNGTGPNGTGPNGTGPNGTGPNGTGPMAKDI